jgi:hypothetical protein
LLALLGTHVTDVALPLIALTLGSPSGTELGLLRGAAQLPLVLIGLHAGVWIDRHPFQLSLGRLLAVRTMVIATVAFIFMAWPSINLLIAGAAALGTANLLYDLRLGTTVLRTFQGGALVSANAKLATMQSLAGIAAPLAVAWLMQSATPLSPLWVGSGLMLLSWLAWKVFGGGPAQDTVPAEGRGKLAVWDGLLRVWDDRLLRQLSVSVGLWNFCVHGSNVAIMLMVVQSMNLPPSRLATCVAVYSVGFLLGAIATPRLLSRVTLGLALFGSLALSLLGLLLAAGAPLLDSRLPYLEGCYAIAGACSAVAQVCNGSLRQLLATAGSFGRVVAAMRLLTWVPIPVGALLAGVACEHLAPQTVLFVLAGGGLLLSAWPMLARSPLLDIRSQT